MMRLSKFSFIWLGLLLVLVACSRAESGLIVESVADAAEKESVVMATSTSLAQATSTSSAQIASPTNTPTAQPTAIQLPTPQLVRADFPNLGPAPEIENEVWLNAEEPVTLASQRGKVVLVEFWTFG